MAIVKKRQMSECGCMLTMYELSIKEHNYKEWSAINYLIINKSVENIIGSNLQNNRYLNL